MRWLATYDTRIQWCIQCQRLASYIARTLAMAKEDDTRIQERTCQKEGLISTDNIHSTPVLTSKRPPSPLYRACGILRR